MGEKQLSTDEAELYDRQIRLWGIESQEKLRAANILLIKVRGLGSEIAKDILLSGINSLTILDDGVVKQEDVRKNFLLNQSSVGSKIADAVLPKAQALNPLVKIVLDTNTVDKKDADFFKSFTMVIATELSKSDILKISNYCREGNVKFICGDNFGMFGYSIADFQEHEYFEDKVKFVTKGAKRSHDGSVTKGASEKVTEKVAGKLNYPSLKDVLALPESPVKTKRRNVYFYLMLALLEFREKYSRNPSYATRDKDIADLKDFAENILNLHQVDIAKLNEHAFDLIFEEIVPICSIVGGVIAQEVIKAVSGREVPVFNTFLLDPFTYAGREETVGAKL